jgi:cytochrome c peroxidase
MAGCDPSRRPVTNSRNIPASFEFCKAVRSGGPQVQQIVDFETKIFTAQTHDRDAGDLDDDGARGGPGHLSKQKFFIGINDPLGLNPTRAPFTSKIFDIYRKWTDIDDREYDEHTASRRSVARGEQLFNTLQIPITGVAGLNDALNQPVINGFCGTCHDSPNVGELCARAVEHRVGG